MSDLDDLKRQLAVLSERVEALEKRPAAAAPAKPVLKPAAAVVRPAPPAELGEKEIGKILGVIGAICFVLAAAFLIKLAVDSGWLTPERQLGLAALLGVGLIAAGLALAEKDPAYAAGLPATGVVILYMTAYGGCLYYGFYGAWTAAFAASAVTAVALGLFMQVGQPLFAGVAVIGTYISPILLPVLRGVSLDSMTFFLVWDILFVELAARLRQRDVITVAAYFALGSFAVTMLTPTDELLKAALVFQLLQAVVFAAGTALYSLRTRSTLTSAQAWQLFPVLLFFYGLEYHWLNRLSPQAAPFFALAFGCFVYGLYHFSKDRLAGVMESGQMVAAFTSIVLVHAGYLELAPERWHAWIGVALLALLPWLSKDPERLPYFLAAFAVAAINYASALIGPSGTGWEERLLLHLAFAGLLLIGYRRPGAGTFHGWYERDLWFAALLAADAQALMGLYRLAAQLAPDGGKDFVVTALWLAFSFAVLFWGRSEKDPVLAKSALFTLSVAAAKGLLVDVSGAEPVVRILCLLLLGGGLYWAGFLFREVQSWDKRAA